MTARTVSGLLMAASPPGGFDMFSIMRVFTSMLPPAASITMNGQYGIDATGLWTNTVTLGQRQTQAHVTEAPLTSGTARVTTTSFPTPVYTISIMGENSLDTVNLTGTISLVAPFLSTVYDRKAGVFTGFNPRLSLPGGRRVTLTFLPEPGSSTLLGVGGLALAALSRWRREGYFRCLRRKSSRAQA